ncbi:chemotaxis protein CheB [Flavobacterium sp.]|uniref:chemotaxis protein CheB n=1 Tax=Flavobacterium sp. TaxID=239 RepID=UPI0037531E48
MKETELIKSTNEFPVVGIGASAGGLSAFKKLLHSISKDSGMAYVLVQHLDPNHESMLTDLLQRVTEIPVLEITDDIKVLPNHIYILPSNKMLIANDGVLELSPRITKKNEPNLPIDLFFTSLAAIHQSHAIGVVLSGTGSDGTKGLKAIREYGGTTFAQDNESADYSGMPNSAVNAGVVDFVLPPENIAEKILSLSIASGKSSDNSTTSPQNDIIFKQIISLLRARKGTDFTYYKQTTVERRIFRRMALNKYENVSDYLAFLQENKIEQDCLYEDLLIQVTSFFRDTDIFDNLCRSVFPNIIKKKQSKESIRFWIAGCSSGQEAYSIAMCLKEYLGNSGFSGQNNVRIFASDLSESAIIKARRGIYSANEVADVSEYRLNTFFTKKNDTYQINKDIRESCVFATHNFLKDPPFSNVDFISCRNVLIYMEPYLQKKAFTTFHYALNSDGFLLLGKSETISSLPDHFIAVGKKEKLYTKNNAQNKVSFVANQFIDADNELNTNNKTKNMQTDFQKTADDIILNNYTPSGVVVNEAMDIVHFRGKTNNYLEQLSGKPTHNLLQMAKTGLAFELRNILYKAKKAKTPVVKENISIEIRGEQRIISIEAMLLPNIVEPHFLILFHEKLEVTIDNEISNVKFPQTAAQNNIKDLRIAQLEKELVQNREDMRAITEDQEAINEELQSANEELLSGSEELQSLNEELESSREELQSTNEELMVVNHDINGLNEKITESRNYAEAIIANVPLPLLILDENLRVQKANAAFYKTFQVNEKDTENILVYDLGNKQWNIPALKTLLENILPEKSTFKDFEITHTFSNIGERIMLLNAREIKKETSAEKLILLVIEDITDYRTTEIEKREIEERYHFVAEAMPQKVWTAAPNGEVEYMNRCWFEYSGLSFEELKHNGWHKIIHPEDLPQTIKKWNEALLTGKNFEIEHRLLNTQNIAKWHLVRGLAQKNTKDEIILWVGTSTEIQEQVEEKELLEQKVTKKTSELQKANKLLEEKNNELGKMNNELQSFAYVSSHDLQEPLRKIQTFSARILDTEFQALSEKGKDYFQRMINTAKRMQTLIEDLIAFSNTNISERKFKNTSLKQIVDDVKNDLIEDINNKNVIIDSSKLGDAYINSFQFRQVFQNLISNSIKFSKQDIQPQIIINSEIADNKYFENQNPTLKLGKLSLDIKYNHITFKDNGIGFDQEYQNRIFEVFQRLNHKENYSGTGIGLAIVKKIIDNHNGVITATGQLNKGAQFDIYIPVS